VGWTKGGEYDVSGGGLVLRDGKEVSKL
jgi:hypothetical protein